MASAPTAGKLGQQYENRARPAAAWALAHTWVSVFLTSGLRAPRAAEHFPGRYALSAWFDRFFKKFSIFGKRSYRILHILYENESIANRVDCELKMNRCSL